MASLACTHLFDLHESSWVLVLVQVQVLGLGPPASGRRLVVGDGDDVTGCGRVAQVSLGPGGGRRRKVRKEGETSGTTTRG